MSKSFHPVYPVHPCSFLPWHDCRCGVLSGGLRLIPPSMVELYRQRTKTGGILMLVHIIADYGHGDLAFAEVVQRIKSYLPDAEPMLTPVPSFSTLAAGFCVAQLGLNAAPAGTIIYHNVAPREDMEAARRDNAGERLAFARLPTGVRVIGVKPGPSVRLVWRKDAGRCAAEGSQFR